jgi:hypothetical protein
MSRHPLPPLRVCVCGRQHRAWKEGALCLACVRERMHDAEVHSVKKETPEPEPGVDRYDIPY